MSSPNHQLAKAEAQHWLQECHQLEIKFPGVMQCLEEALLEHGSFGVTFEIARYAAFLFFLKSTGIQPLDQSKFPVIEHARMALQSTLILRGGYRFTQQIFSFDPTIAGELTKTSSQSFSDTNNRPLPVDFLERMPYSHFVMVPNLAGEILSILVSKYQLPGEEPLLELNAHCVPEQTKLQGAVIRLSPGVTMREALDRTLQAAAKYEAEKFLPTRSTMARLLSCSLPLILYLCAENREVSGDLAVPLTKSKTKKGLRIFPPHRPNIADVAIRIGAAIRAHRASTGQGPHSAEASGTGSPKAPHMRTCHWHTYWIGSRADADNRRQILYYLPPIPVKLDIGQEPPSIIHPVRP